MAQTQTREGAAQLDEGLRRGTLVCDRRLADFLDHLQRQPRQATG